jgi:tRNA (guanine37-N1)-methyltransferase
MHITIITALPELIESPLGHSILKRAQVKELLSVEVIDLRKYGIGPYRQLDDYQYGGNAGMVMMAEPLAKAIDEQVAERKYDEIIYLTPDGERLDQAMANQMSMCENLMMICGHYKGIDDRIRELYVTKEISIGDYVLSGGELAAAVLVDALGRLIPGVLSDGTSALEDSFQDGLLAPPVYTRPDEFRGIKVPEVLLTGDHKAIAKWREEQALERTQARRPDLLDEE